MPTPSTTALPCPKSWDEFEDICADVLKSIWKDPYISRNGRNGQRQHGVDIFGQPKHLGGLGSGIYSGAQCKNTNSLNIATVRAEVEEARHFNPKLSEYLVMTSASRDAQLQKDIRIEDWPFRVEVMFWEDISLELSGHADLLHKHFPGWMRKLTTEEHILEMVLSSNAKDFRYDDSTGIFFLKSDVRLRLIPDREDQFNRGFFEPWVKRFADSEGFFQLVYIQYDDTRVKEIPCVYVDGCRHIIPCPKSRAKLTITPFLYRVGRILNHPKSSYYDFDDVLRRAGITVED